MAGLRPVSGTAAEVLALLRDWDAADDPEPLVVETSGSTGGPKRVVLSRAAVRASADAAHARLGGPGQWLLTVAPSYVAGLQVLFRSVRAGTEPVVGAPGDALGPSSESMTGDRRYVSLVPTQLHRCLQDADEVRALTRFDAVLVGGGPLRRRDRAAAEAAGVRVVQTYGMSETCGGCVYDGVPLDGVAVRVDAHGEVLVSGAVLFDGYLDDPSRTAAVLRDGWLRTDDLGEVDGDGRLRITGRADDVVVSGAVKVPPVAVEEMLAEHPGVLEVAVVGVPDDEWGERVVAVVRPVPGLPAPALPELRDLVTPRTWAPRQVVAVAAPLPRTGRGKLDRACVRGLVRG